MLEMTRTDPEWKDKLITGDETWVYGYDPETKCQSAEWRGQDIAPNDFFLFPKLKAVLKGRHFDTRDDIIEKSLLALKSIPKEAYKNCLDNWEKRWRCPDLAPCDFILFGKLKKKKKLKGRKFQSIEEIKVESKKAMKAIPKTDYQSLRGCRHEPKTSFRVVQALLGGSGRDRRQRAFRSTSTTPEKVDKVLELVREDRRITVREVAEEAGISFGSTQSIMKDILGMRSLNAVLVPKELTFDQKNARKETASLNLEATTDDPELLKRVITGDETWIYGFDSETTQPASEWRFKNEPRPKKARKAPSKVKVMLTVFFDYQGIVHHGFQQQGSTITADSYLGVLRRLREAIRQKRPEL
ncbi:hypothetical protein LAZ67_9002438 [Cordylochernes scorpioides]|uniref:Transposase n=1 Tax=Cordylochernes scorpioides TaxID=51811 RepID=A0ABY6KUH4_9ARAC|nr:hypothetical protein LAZ67_9002438 [Cordylochernes scorpioides]